jgi:hypothetical protein
MLVMYLGVGKGRGAMQDRRDKRIEGRAQSIKDAGRDCPQANGITLWAGGVQANVGRFRPDLPIDAAARDDDPLEGTRRSLDRRKMAFTPERITPYHSTDVGRAGRVTSDGVESRRTAVPSLSIILSINSVETLATAWTL